MIDIVVEKDQYGDWTVLDKIPKLKKGLRRVLCRCACGLESNVRYYDLIGGKSRRCIKCNTKNQYSNFPKHDLTNQTIGEWKCLRPIKKSSGWFWECECSCGTIRLVKQGDLVGGRSLKCHGKKFDTNDKFTGYGCISGTLWNRIKKGARVRDIDFALTIEEAHNLAEKQNFLCAMTKIPLVFPYRSTNTEDSNASLDRIDSSGGYCLENVQWVTINCNLAKQALGKKEFIELCIGITMNYLKESEKTENKDYTSMVSRLDDTMMQLLHAAIGLGTESGELLDSVKKSLIYGAELDKKNVSEEIGDIFWYLALACRSINVNFEEVCQNNINKLKVRYPDKFSGEAALIRADKLGDNYYAFPVAGSLDSWYVVKKTFWDTNGYVDETEEIDGLIHNIPGFRECMESCITPIRKGMSSIEIVSLLESYGFTILKEVE